MKDKTNLIFFFIITSLLSYACTKTVKVHKTNIVKQDTTSIQNKTVALSTHLNVQDTLPKIANQYFLIIGSFSNKENAENLQKELIQKGFDSQIFLRKTEVNTDLYNVSYKGFHDKTEAYKQLSTDKQKFNKPDIWLYSKN